MPHFLAEFAPGASRHLLESFSLVGLPLLICGARLNGLRYRAVSVSGKRLRL
jgi:hypothetical protein